ncbi:MAG: sugar transferase [Candidatus Liptonbacteria bacterium]|nr:sugar transferase [Candidatus Liptonbacteria bacterium]
MKLSQSAKVFFLVLGDIVVLYASLALTLVIRYGAGFIQEFPLHALPFSIIFAVWLAVFYLNGLYDLRHLRNNLEFSKVLGLALSVNALLTIAVFYLVPVFGIAPRRNLFIFLVLFAALEMFWRRSFNVRLSFREGLVNVLLLGETESAREIAGTLHHNPQIGYEIKAWFRQGLSDPETRNLGSSVKRLGINLIVVPRSMKLDPKFAKVFYELLSSGIEIIDIPTFYEAVFRKVPLGELEDAWFLEHRVGGRKFYDDFKRSISFVSALILFIFLSPLMLIIALLITLTSPGPAICTQIRAGKHNRPYAHFKFRTMKSCKEKEGPRWTSPGDERITPIGKILRHSHLDELPQLINIIKDDLAFVGPRPERPEFVTMLIEKIPYYNIRFLIKPGVTGWAQIHHRSDQTTDDVIQKLQYELYYLKNRSFVLDLAIIIKTIKTLFVTPR